MTHPLLTKRLFNFDCLFSEQYRTPMLAGGRICILWGIFSAPTCPLSCDKYHSGSLHLD